MHHASISAPGPDVDVGPGSPQPYVLPLRPHKYKKHHRNRHVSSYSHNYNHQNYSGGHRSHDTVYFGYGFPPDHTRPRSHSSHSGGLRPPPGLGRGLGAGLGPRRLSLSLAGLAGHVDLDDGVHHGQLAHEHVQQSLHDAFQHGLQQGYADGYRAGHNDGVLCGRHLEAEQASVQQLGSAESFDGQVDLIDDNVDDNDDGLAKESPVYYTPISPSAPLIRVASAPDLDSLQPPNRSARHRRQSVHGPFHYIEAPPVPEQAQPAQSVESASVVVKPVKCKPVPVLPVVPLLPIMPPTPPTPPTPETVTQPRHSQNVQSAVDKKETDRVKMAGPILDWAEEAEAEAEAKTEANAEAKAPDTGHPCLVDSSDMSVALDADHLADQLVVSDLFAPFNNGTPTLVYESALCFPATLDDEDDGPASKHVAEAYPVFQARPRSTFLSMYTMKPGLVVPVPTPTPDAQANRGDPFPAVFPVGGQGTFAAAHPRIPDHVVYKHAPAAGQAARCVHHDLATCPVCAITPSHHFLGPTEAVKGTVTRPDGRVLDGRVLDGELAYPAGLWAADKSLTSVADWQHADEADPRQPRTFDPHLDPERLGRRPQHADHLVLSSGPESRAPATHYCQECGGLTWHVTTRTVDGSRPRPKRTKRAKTPARLLLGMDHPSHHASHNETWMIDEADFVGRPGVCRAAFALETGTTRTLFVEAGAFAVEAPSTDREPNTDREPPHVLAVWFGAGSTHNARALYDVSASDGTTRIKDLPFETTTRNGAQLAAVALALHRLWTRVVPGHRARVDAVCVAEKTSDHGRRKAYRLRAVVRVASAYVATLLGEDIYVRWQRVLMPFAGGGDEQTAEKRKKRSKKQVGAEAQPDQPETKAETKAETVSNHDSDEPRLGGETDTDDPFCRVTPELMAAVQMAAQAHFDQPGVGRYVFVEQRSRSKGRPRMLPNGTLVHLVGLYVSLLRQHGVSVAFWPCGRDGVAGARAVAA